MISVKSWVLILFFFISVAVLQANEKIVRVATLSDFPPYCFKKNNSIEKLLEIIPVGSDSQQLQGYSWDIVRSSFHASGYKIHLMVVPWSRAMYYVQSGKADITFPAIMTSQRKREFLFSRQMVDQSKILIYVKKENQHVWRGLPSIRDKDIAVVRAWSYGQKWDSEDEVGKVQVNSILQGFAMLDKNRVFGVIGYEVVFDHALKNAGILHMYKKSPAIEVSAEYLLGAKNHEIKVKIDAFDDGKTVIMRDGTLGKIRKKWAIVE